MVTEPDFSTLGSYRTGQNLELLLAAVAHLHVQAMRSVPVAVYDVRLAVTVEVSERHPAAMLHGVLHPWATEGKEGEVNKCPYITQHVHMTGFQALQLEPN